jgi:hypothetical protein
MSKYLKTLHQLAGYQNTVDSEINACESVTQLTDLEACKNIACENCILNTSKNIHPVLKILNNST